MTVVALKREGNPEAAGLLREYADDVESGLITEFVFVSYHVEDGHFMHTGAFQDRWRLLGALAHANYVACEN